MSKPAPDPTYPAYAVSDTDSDNEITRVAAVTGLKSYQNQKSCRQPHAHPARIAALKCLCEVGGEVNYIAIK